MADLETLRKEYIELRKEWVAANTFEEGVDPHVEFKNKTTGDGTITDPEEIMKKARGMVKAKAEPPAEKWTWADTARMMAKMFPEGPGFPYEDWDDWKDRRKEGDDDY